MQSHKKERIRSHRWMQIIKFKGVEYIGNMENKLKEMGRELSVVIHREAITRTHLETKNELLRRQLQEKETQLAYISRCSMEALLCRTPKKSYGVYLKDQWL